MREHVEEVNSRVVDHMRHPMGPRVPIRRLDADEVVARWHAARERRRAAARPAAPSDAARLGTVSESGPRSRGAGGPVCSAAETVAHGARRPPGPGVAGPDRRPGPTVSRSVRGLTAQAPPVSVVRSDRGGQRTSGLQQRLERGQDRGPALTDVTGVPCALLVVGETGVDDLQLDRLVAERGERELDDGRRPPAARSARPVKV